MTVIIDNVKYEDWYQEKNFKIVCTKCGNIPEIEVYEEYGSPYCNIICHTCKLHGNQYNILEGK